MSSTPKAGPRTTLALVLSVAIYRQMLLAYPVRFRVAYGPHMTQVFRDCCRQVQRERGVWGLMRLWPRAVADLAVSVLAEHYAGGIRMSRWTPARYCAFAAMLGGAAWLTFVLLSLGAFVLSLVSHGALYNGLNPNLAYVFDATWVLIPLALMGVMLLAGDRIGVLAWLGYTIAFAGALMLLVGNLGTTYVWSNATYKGGVQVVHLTGFDLIGANLQLALYWSSFVGYPVLGIGLALVGLQVWRVRALPRFNMLPLGLGVFVALQYFFTNMGAPSLLRNTGTPGLLVMVTETVAFVVVWAIGWILLGRMVWIAAETPSPTSQSQAQVQATLATPQSAAS